MRTIIAHTRSLATMLTLAIAFLAANAAAPPAAICQEDEGGCDHGRVYSETDEDGTVWLCVEDIECESFKASEFCVPWPF